MRLPAWPHVGLFLLLMIWCTIGMDQTSAQPTGDNPSGGVKRALLIGINKYKAVPKLQGSLNDIETMRQILITRWGFSERNITMVTDEAATRAGMLAAFEQLVKDAGPQDTVYVHYSGHGSQVEDLNGDETDDHLDETLVPQDGRSGDVRDITDDELDAIFARLRARNTLIVLDSCHSGTATRSLDIRTRSIPRDSRVDLYRKAEHGTTRTRAVVPVMTSRYVVMTGAASHQEALDGPIDGRYHGFFTFALARSLSSSSPQASAREVFGGVERELKRIQTHFGRSSMPEPQLEAPPELLEKTLLGTGQSASESHATRLPWVEVQAGDAGQITLINGPLLGANPGSVWSLYQADEIQFPPGRALAVATVTQIMGKDAKATLQTTSGKIPAGARAVLLLPAPTGNRIPIRLLDIPQDRRKLIEETIKTNLKDADLVGPEQSARFLVDLQGESLRLLAADGLQVVATFGLGESWGSGLATVVSRSANASELLTLDNPSSQLKIDVRVSTAPVPQTTVTTRGIAIVAADTQPARYRIRRSGEPRTVQNSLQLEVRVNADAYLTIVDVDSEGAVNLLFPNAYQQRSFYGDGLLHANESILLPDSLQQGNRAGYYWDYSPPKGTDTIRVFASTDRETAQMIRQRIQALQNPTAQTRGGVSTRSVSSTMKTLREGLSTRGLTLVYDPTSHIPTKTEAGPSPTPTMPAGSSSLPTAQTMPSSAPSSGPAPDWAATTVTVQVEA